MDKEKRRMLKLLDKISEKEDKPITLPQKRPPTDPLVNKNWKKNPSYKVPKSAAKHDIVAIDCEMVSTNSDQNSLARVSIVDMDGNVLLDEYVKQSEPVNNYRTSITGIKARHLKNAKSFNEIQKLVTDALKNKLVIGHAISHDLKALKINLPANVVRDTQKLYKLTEGVSTISLQKLALEKLGKAIQIGHHSSIEDARATMEIYKTLFLSKKL
ncbi:unnamed protein product [Blepharisma stoltei]|uniref:RNA exonuclease 4 n=1 Tax=Blepharisma stoltei TaxID=1481888 RepID=A0AAU9JYT1_9CILI|nr:unnamed protein product [Blepharisma stoltei]